MTSRSGPMDEICFGLDWSSLWKSLSLPHKVVLSIEAGSNRLRGNGRFQREKDSSSGDSTSLLTEVIHCSFTPFAQSDIELF